MKIKSLIFISIAFVAIIVAIFLVFELGKMNNEKQFAYTDTSNIHKIIIKAYNIIRREICP